MGLIDVANKLRTIAYVTESFTMGGVERSTALLIRNLDRTKFNPILFCANESGIAPMVAEVQAMGVHTVQTDLISMRRQHADPFEILALSRLLKKYKIDILHIQLLGGTGARYISIAAKLAGVPVVVKTVRGASLERLSWKWRYINRFLDKYVTLYTVASHDNRMLQINNVGRIPDKVKVIYNAIDVDAFDPGISKQSARQVLSIPGGGPLIGTIGRLDSQKGIEYFLEMAALVHSSVPDARFIIIGDGEQREAYENFAKVKGLTGLVTFTGYRADVDQCLAALDVFVLSSTFEPFGLVLAEAMAMEKPVVATRVGGIPEVVADGQNGFIVPPRDPRSLAKAVLKYIEDPNISKEHGLYGRKRVIEYFSVNRLMREMENMYDGLLNMNHG